MFVRTMETLAGGEWTGADTWVDVFDPVDVRQPVVRVPALTAAQVAGISDAAGFKDSGSAFKKQGVEALGFSTRVKTVAIHSGR